MVILAKTNVKEMLEKYPELKDVLITFSPKFKKLNSKFVLNTIGKWATVGDVAKIGNISLCELIHNLNKEIGMEEEIAKFAPDCIKEVIPKLSSEKTETPDWVTNAKQVIIQDVRERDDFFFLDIMKTIKSMESNQILKVINSFYPAPLLNLLEEEKYESFYEKTGFEEHILYINYKERKKDGSWLDRREEFPVMDVRGWREDPFSEIIKQAHELPEGEGFKIIQYFVPRPLLNMLEPMGFEFHIDKKGPVENHVYFYKKPSDKAKKTKSSSGRVPLVIQSATPVVYPLVMRLLQSDRLMSKIKIEEFKIWDKTEKHLGWIMSGKADISFSAVAAVAKLYQKGLDIKMKSIVLWDNFFIMTNNPNIKSFDDLKGKEIHLPLIKAAPPYAVTTFLMKELGYNPRDFKFVFGEPFGRPNDIKNLLIRGKAEVGLLREPEASFAVFESKGKVVEAFSYKSIWEKLFAGMGDLPNAGVLFKGEILREYPKIAEIFLEETEEAIKWVTNNPKESAAMSYELMGIPPEEVELFLSRVHYNYGASENVVDDITHYIDILNKSGYGSKPFGELRELFI